MTNYAPLLVLEYKTNRFPFEPIYKALMHMIKNNMPMTKYDITSNRNIQKMLMLNKFVILNTNEDNVLFAKRTDVSRYIISSKGLEFIKRYTYIKELFN